MHARLLGPLLCLAAALLIAGCANTANQTTTWRDPAYSGPPFKKVFVIGLSSRDLKDQRGFEDLMVSSLQSFGIVAVPGWQFVPADRTPDQATIRAAVAKAGADGVLLSRLSGFTTEGYVSVGNIGATYAVGPSTYVGWDEPGLVETDVRVARIYTTFFDVRTAKPVWTYDAPTYDPASLQQNAPIYANTVAGMLQSNGLVAPR